MWSQLVDTFNNYPYLTPDKLEVAVQSSLLLLVFVLSFLFVYYRYFSANREARRIFLIFGAAFGFIVLAKFAIGFFFKGYIPELSFFYAIPSPKMMGVGWLVLAIAVFALFLFLIYYGQFLKVIP